jgi:hypothetical protein
VSSSYVAVVERRIAENKAVFTERGNIGTTRLHSLVVEEYFVRT